MILMFLLFETLSWPQLVRRVEVRRTLNREGASEHLDDGTVEEILSEHGGVDGGWHEDDLRKHSFCEQEFN